MCTGSIETSDQNPEAAASREVLEETGLGKGNIKLLRRGKPYRLVDQELQTVWTIHPFAWQLEANASAKPIKLDSEHTEYKFIHPKDLKNYDHVPHLEIALKRVLISPELEEGLAALSDKHLQDTQGLMVAAVTLLHKLVSNGKLAKCTSIKEFWDELRWYGWHIIKTGLPNTHNRPDLSIPVLRILLAVQAKLGTSNPASIDNMPEILRFTNSQISSTMDLAQNHPDALVTTSHRKIRRLEKKVFTDL